jgi:hypothetical protein
VRELNSLLTDINNMIDAEKKNMDKLSQIRNITEAQYWWTRPFHVMDLDQCILLFNILRYIFNFDLF